MSFIKSISVAIATLATAAAVQAQYNNAAPPSPTEPVSPPQSGAVVDHTQPTSPPSGAMLEPAQPQASPSVTWTADPSEQPKSREEVKGEAKAAARDGTIQKIDSEHGLTPESPLLSPEH